VLADGDEPVTDEEHILQRQRLRTRAAHAETISGPMWADSPALLRACSYVGLLSLGAFRAHQLTQWGLRPSAGSSSAIGSGQGRSRSPPGLSTSWREAGAAERVTDADWTMHRIPVAGLASAAGSRNRSSSRPPRNARPHHSCSWPLSVAVTHRARAERQGATGRGSHSRQLKSATRRSSHPSTSKGRDVIEFIGLNKS
jgi:hypothetical protein